MSGTLTSGRRNVLLLLVLVGLLNLGWLALRAFENSRVYPADRRAFPPSAVGLTGFEAVRIATPDGESIVGWWRPPPPGAGTVLYLHGNGGNLAYRAERLADLAVAGMGVLAIDYRGYGGSTGRPSERGLHADAAAAYRWTRARAPGRPVAVIGESLGTGVAVRLAAEEAVATVVLDSAYASLPDVVERMAPWLPTRLMTNRFESDRWIGRVDAPVLMVHCSADPLTPLASAQALQARARSARLHVVLGCGHTAAWADPSTRTLILSTLRQALLTAN